MTGMYRCRPAGSEVTEGSGGRAPFMLTIGVRSVTEMSENRRQQIRRGRRPWLAGVAAFNAFAAWAGAFGLVTGGIDFGATINDRLPFQSLVLAGVALAVIVGGPLAVLAWSAWTGGPRTDDLALVAGLMLVGWIVGQVVVIRAFSPFQPAYLAVGAALVAASHRVPAVSALQDRPTGICPGPAVPETSGRWSRGRPGPCGPGVHERGRESCGEGDSATGEEGR